MTLAAVAPTVTLAEIAMVPTGGFSIALIATANSLLQLNSSEQMRGRVMSLYSIAFLGTTPIGAPLVGLVVSWSNPRVGILMGAVFAVLTSAGLFVQQRQELRNLATLHSAETL